MNRRETRRAVVQLGRCFDLLDESVTAALAEAYRDLAGSFTAAGEMLPSNTGRDWKHRIKQAGFDPEAYPRDGLGRPSSLLNPETMAGCERTTDGNWLPLPHTWKWGFAL